MKPVPHVLIPVEPVYDPKLRRLCRKPYPGHPHGCPARGTKPECPPEAPLLPKILNLDLQTWVIYNQFDLKAHAAEMKAKHPKWTERQCRNLLYWQQTARKQLRTAAIVAISLMAVKIPKDHHIEVLYVPEACGLNVTATCESIGLTLTWPPNPYAHQVALVGWSSGPVRSRSLDRDRDRPQPKWRFE
jgi:hypothetical protein